MSGKSVQSYSLFLQPRRIAADFGTETGPSCGNPQFVSFLLVSAASISSTCRNAAGHVDVIACPMSLGIVAFAAKVHKSSSSHQTLCFSRRSLVRSRNTK